MITVVLHRQCVQHYPVHVLCTCNITHAVYIHTGIQCHSIVSGYIAALHYLFYLMHSISQSTIAGLASFPGPLLEGLLHMTFDPIA